MESSLLPTFVTLLLIACGVAMVAQWLRQPYSIALVLVGLGVALTKSVPDIPITHEFIFTFILPPLLFQAALHLDLEQLRNNWRTIVILSFLEVLASTFLIGWVFAMVLGLPLVYGFLFGAIISPSDPISVVAILKKIRAPDRLAIIMEGKSVLNESVSVVLFTLILSIVTGKHAFQWGRSLWQFGEVILGGMLVGVVLGLAVYYIMKKIDDHLLEVTLTVVLAFGTPLIAEHFHVSGIIAVVAAGLIIGNYGRFYSMSERTRKAVETFWETTDFIINSLLFLVIGIQLQIIPRENLLAMMVHPVSLVFLVTLLARAIVIYPVGRAMQFTKERIPLRWAHVLFWGGLKGSIPLALAVDIPLKFEHRALFLEATFLVVLFSLVGQGLTLEPVIKKMNLFKENK